MADHYFIMRIHTSRSTLLHLLSNNMTTGLVYKLEEGEKYVSGNVCGRIAGVIAKRYGDTGFAGQFY